MNGAKPETRQPTRPKCRCGAMPPRRSVIKPHLMPFDIHGWATIVPYDETSSPMLMASFWLCRKCMRKAMPMIPTQMRG